MKPLLFARPIKIVNFPKPDSSVNWVFLLKIVRGSRLSYRSYLIIFLAVKFYGQEVNVISFFTSIIYEGDMTGIVADVSYNIIHNVQKTKIFS